MNALITRFASRIPPSARSILLAEHTLPTPLVAAVLDQMKEGVLIADLREAGTPLSYVNRGFETITGYSREEAVGKNCRYLQGNDRLQPEIDQIREGMMARKPISVTLRNYRKDGRRFFNELSLLPVFDVSGEATHYVGLMRDVTEQRHLTETLDRAANLDQLTGILNRYGFVERFDEILRTEPVGLPLVVKADIAHFHEINSGFGYDLGDALLQEVARRLLKLDAPIVARVGGDQFAILCTLDNREEADTCLTAIRDTLARQYVLAGATMDVQFAIGFVVGAPGMTALSLVRQAGSAMHQSKITKLREQREFDHRDDRCARNRVRTTSELQQAIANDEFCFQYQPKVDLRSGALVGAEALLRWNHGIFGLQPPSRFIELAEETGLILDIGHWGRHEVARFAAEINRNRSTPLHFAVNVSAIELTHRDLAASLTAALETSGADPAWLTLELTESLMADGTPELITRFKKLRSLGVGLSVDDFGTGYSSLRYLEQFPLSEIKIDRNFICEMSSSPAKRVIVRAIIELGHELGIDIVAEGIELEEEKALLQKMNCPFGQGFLFSRPLDAAKFATMAEQELSFAR